MLLSGGYSHEMEIIQYGCGGGQENRVIIDGTIREHDINCAFDISCNINGVLN